MSDDRTEQALEASAEAVAPQVPPAPRPVTPRARRRSWAELPVRVWVLLTVAVAAVTVYFTTTRVSEALRDRELIEHGMDVKARFESVMGDPVPKRRPRNEAMLASISFTVNGKRYELPIRLEAQPGSFAMVGTELPIKVDPNDPQRWTEQTQPKPWATELTVVGLLVPLLVIVALITFLKRRSVLKVWENGDLMAGTVIETRQTAIAPASRVLRFTLRDGGDRRVFSTVMPSRAGIPQAGQTIWLICPPTNPGRAVVAKLYL